MKKAHKRLLKLLAALLSIGAGATIFFSIFKDAMVFYYTPKDCQHQPIEKNKTIRIGGIVQKNSHVLYPKGGGRFIVQEGNDTILVEYSCSLPTLFKEETMVVAQGTFNDEGQFSATEVLAKHDENYAPLPKNCLQEQVNQWSQN